MALMFMLLISMIEVAKENDNSDVQEINLHTIMRTRAVRLLQSCCCNVDDNKSVANVIESIIAKDYGICEVKYFELITRIAFKLMVTSI